MTEKSSGYQVLGVGEACLDLIVPITEDFLKEVPGEKGGSCIIDHELMDEILLKSRNIPKLIAGGSCANAIKGLANLGIKCAFMSRISSDAFGKYYSRELQQQGIIPIFYESTHPCPRVLCMITPDGQRTMRVCMGDREEIPKRFLQRNYFKGVKLVHLEAYTLRYGDITKRVMQLAKMAQAKISIDLSSFEVVNQYRSQLQELLPQYVDIVFANKAETNALTELDSYEGCRELQEMCSIAVVMMGNEGCLVGHEGKIFQSAAVTTAVLDTTGAGDLFASGFLYGYLNEDPLMGCARFGNVLAAAVLDVWGGELPTEKWISLRRELL